MSQRLLLAIASTLLSVMLHAQFPPNYNGLSYQAVIRDAAGNPLPNQAISLRAQIIPGLGLGYVETHSITTDANGLISILLGQGTPEPGSFIPTFDDVNFADGSLWGYTIQVDLAGGTSWSFLGGGPFKAVPFAHLAASSLKPWRSSTVNNSTYTSDNSNVGIGTDAPVNRFTVRQDGIGISQENGDGTVRVGTYADAANGAYIQTHSNHPLKFSTNNGATHMTLATNGFLGLGTNTPAAKLHVNGGFRLNDGTQGTGKVLTSDADGDATWVAAAATAAGNYTPTFSGSTGFVSIPACECTYNRTGSLVNVLCTTGSNAMNFGAGINTVNMSLPPGFDATNMLSLPVANGTFSSDHYRNGAQTSTGTVSYNTSTNVKLTMKGSTAGAASAYWSFVYKTSAP